MNKENNRNAAGLRRSAIAERIRLREEWTALKGTTDNPTNNRQKQTGVLANKHQNTNKHENRKRNPYIPQKTARSTQATTTAKNNQVRMPATSDVLRGVVALVDVGAEAGGRALALRAALTALGASVVPAWTPIVTHLIWAQGGCRATRAKARALASRLVSPLWVEACAASGLRLPEQAFPAAARPSDLPSPRTLRQLLKKAEMENISLINLLTDEDDKEKPPRLRMSSETEHDTTADTSHDTSRDLSSDKSRDTSKDKSRDTTKDTTAEIETRVNTAPRRALPISISPPRPAKSRRKLFTQKEAEETRTTATDEESEEETATKAVQTRLPNRQAAKPTHKERKDLARAERLAKRLLATCGGRTASQPPGAHQGTTPRIVLTGMGRAERQAVTAAIQKLNGKIQSHVTKKTTHVLLGSCQEAPGITQRSPSQDTVDKRTNNSAQCISDVTQSILSAKISPLKSANNHMSDRKGFNITGVSSLTNVEPRVVHRSDLVKARTLNALLGAARGCRVLRAQWVIDSAEAGRWLHHHGYEVPHLKKISQKARIERTALGRMRSDYAYDVFCGMRVRIAPDAEQKEAATQLLKLCGAITQDGGDTQNGGCDLTIGRGNGEVNSKWVFDSVAAARMRTTRRYINNPITSNMATQVTNSNR